MKTTEQPSKAEHRHLNRMQIPGSLEILEYARRLGLRRAFFRGVYVATNQLVKLSIFDCFSLRSGDINQTLAKTDRGFECRFLTSGEGGRFSHQLNSEMSKSLHEAIDRGDAVHVILDGEKLASIGLYAEAPTPVSDDLIVHFDPPARYMYRGYTQEAYRGQRLHALGILSAAQELFDLKVPQLVTVCERTNYPAAISVYRMGWQPCGALYSVGVGRWAWTGRTTAARTSGLGLRLRSPEVID